MTDFYYDDGGYNNIGYDLGTGLDYTGASPGFSDIGYDLGSGLDSSYFDTSFMDPNFNWGNIQNYSDPYGMGYAPAENPWYEDLYKDLGGAGGIARLGLGGLSMLGNYLASREQRDDARNQFDRTLAFKEKELGLTSNTDLAKTDAIMGLLAQRDRAQLDPRRYAEIIASGQIPTEMMSQPVELARGGLGRVQGLLRGGSPGQADLINARLSDGEYVMDAETVSALGDGNTEAGAQRLDKMREELRRHKRSASPRSIPPPAKDPRKYMKGVK